MKRSLKNLKEYKVETTDGQHGKVKDFLFDEESWTIRYLEADFGNLFKDKRVLIPGTFLKKPDWDGKNFHINLRKSDIESCPDIDQKMPVSKKYEEELSKHYGISNYWPYAYTGTAAISMFYPPRPMEPPAKIVSENDLDTELRSFDEVRGYHLKAIDGKFGHIEDLLADDEDWQVVYAVIDTGNFKPWDREVLLSINWMDKISYVDREISINLNSETIKDAPAYEGISSVNTDFENILYDFYSNSLKK
ncbi:MAG: PRC-barrel domain-containing protein [Bacteroidales bacterium]